MGHYALNDGENVAQEMVEEGDVVYKMHPCSEDNQQNGGNEGFFAGHNGSVRSRKNTRSYMQLGCILQTGAKLDNKGENRLALPPPLIIVPV